MKVAIVLVVGCVALAQGFYHQQGPKCKFGHDIQFGEPMFGGVSHSPPIFGGIVRAQPSFGGVSGGFGGVSGGFGRGFGDEDDDGFRVGGVVQPQQRFGGVSGGFGRSFGGVSGGRGFVGGFGNDDGNNLPVGLGVGNWNRNS